MCKGMHLASVGKAVFNGPRRYVIESGGSVNVIYSTSMHSLHTTAIKSYFSNPIAFITLFYYSLLTCYQKSDII